MKNPNYRLRQGVALVVTLAYLLVLFQQLFVRLPTHDDYLIWLFISCLLLDVLGPIIGVVLYRHFRRRSLTRHNVRQMGYREVFSQFSRFQSIAFNVGTYLWIAGFFLGILSWIWLMNASLSWPLLLLSLLALCMVAMTPPIILMISTVKILPPEQWRPDRPPWVR